MSSRSEPAAALRSDVERVDFIARLYGAVMADRMRQMFDAVPDDGTCDGFAQSVRRSIDGEMEDDAASRLVAAVREVVRADEEDGYPVGDEPYAVWAAIEALKGALEEYDRG